MLVLLVAAVCVAAVGTLVWYRARPVSMGSVIRALPAKDSVMVFIDFAALRRSGMMERIFGTRTVEDDDYRRFVQDTGFNFRDDLEYAAATIGPIGKYAVLRGSFDWTKLRAYVSRQRGECILATCQMAGSAPDRRISFRPLQNNLMAFAVSKDEDAVKRIQLGPSRPALELPAAPVWMQIPGSVLKGGNSLPTGTQMFAHSMERANAVYLMLGTEDNRIAAQLDVDSHSGEEAATVVSQLAQATERLRQMIELEHQKPNPADLSGVLASGSFRAEGSHARGRWIIEDVFLDNVFSGAAH